MSLQTRLAALVSAIGTDIKTLTTGVAQAEKRAVLVPDTDSTVDEASAVVWKRTSDGAYIAYKKVREQGTTPNRSYIENDVVDAEGGGTGFASWTQEARVLVSGVRKSAYLGLSAIQGVGGRSINLGADSDTGSEQRKLLDSAGKSDFIQKGVSNFRKTLPNQTATVTFTGLDGENDLAYEILVQGTLHPNGSPGRLLTARPNAAVGSINAYHRNTRNNDGSFTHDVGAHNDIGILLGRSDIQDGAGSFMSRTTIQAKTTTSGRRTAFTEWAFTPLSSFAVVRGVAGAVYYGDTSALSTLDINFDSQTFNGVITLKALM